MLAVIKHIVDNNIICLSATQLMHATVHGACNTVQRLLCKTLNIISAELWPQQAKSIDYKIQGVYSSVNMSCKSVNKIEKIKKQLVKLWKSGSSTLD